MMIDFSRGMFHALTLLASFIVTAENVDTNSVSDCARSLGETLADNFARATQFEDIVKAYSKASSVEQFDPRAELKRARESIEKYLRSRAKYAWNAKQSLEGRELPLIRDDRQNDPEAAWLVRYMSAKRGNNNATIYRHGANQREVIGVNATREFVWQPNANFFHLLTSSQASAVHVPTPVYERDPSVLWKVSWSDIDGIYSRNRDKNKDLAFQLFCSEAGFMRYFPAASWAWDNPDSPDSELLDLFDCRNTEWYINGATCSKNVLIALDLSGSMLGQRFEIAKQTIESVLDTLSHNDYFNIMPFSKSAYLLGDCGADDTAPDGRQLLQATSRNKRRLRELLDSVASEGRAAYEQGLALAFHTLLGLPGSVEWLGADVDDSVQMSRDPERLVARFPPPSSDNSSTTTTTTARMKRRVVPGAAAGAQPVRRQKVVYPQWKIVSVPGDSGPADHQEKSASPLRIHPEYGKAITNASRPRGSARQWGCEDVLMLITDGAPQGYRDLFELYNKEKHVRVFTTLIGEEAIEFDQVRQMACENRGFMVHVQNMADAVEKVQHYIRVMSRPLGAHPEAVEERDALWSGVYRERLYLPRPNMFREPAAPNASWIAMKHQAARRRVIVQRQEARARMFVTTVSYPVIKNGTLMGVAAVNVPLTEINQLAAPINIGARSYFFLLDRHNFVMLHPQLRAIDPETKQARQNYNNMEMLELEVADNDQQSVLTSETGVLRCQASQTLEECVRTIAANVDELITGCENGDPPKLDVLFASDPVDRVYRQSNTYYSECIYDGQFTLGLAVADDDDWRVRPLQPFSAGRVSPHSVEGDQWRVHPHWRYCILNDSDALVGKENAFRVYVEQMHKRGRLPEACTHRKSLLERIMFDLSTTQPLPVAWQQQDGFMRSAGIHLVWWTAPSGMFRFYNLTLNEFRYELPVFDVTAFLSDAGVVRDTEPYLRTYQNFVNDTFRKSVDEPYYKRAVRNDERIVFDIVNRSRLWYPDIDTTSPFGQPENETLLLWAAKAVKLDGRAILGVAGHEMAYDSFAALLKKNGCGPERPNRWCVLLDEHAYVVYSSLPTTSYSAFLDNSAENVLKKWFGNLNPLTEKAFQLLLEAGFFTKIRYTDHQTTCLRKPAQVTSSAIGPISPLRALMKLVNWVLTVFAQFSLYSEPPSVEAYTQTFGSPTWRKACSATSDFYLAQPASSKPHFRAHVHVCNCQPLVSAAWVPATNLLMVWMDVGSEPDVTICMDALRCLHTATDVFGREWRPLNASMTATTCGRKSTRPQTHVKCIQSSADEEERFACSRASRSVLSSAVLLVLLLFLHRI